jgi:hypothetical protein
VSHRSRTARAAAPARPKRAAGRRWGAIAAALALLAAAAAVVIPRLHLRPAPVGAGDPAAALDVRQAYVEGARLYKEKRFIEAIPLFRRVGALLPAPQRQFHLQFADVLERAALQSRPDRAQPASRSSAERVACVREALAQLEAAERLSATAREVAEIRAWRASVLRVWGFPWEALQEMRAARAADPTYTAIGEAADVFVYRLHHPEVRVPGLDDDALPGLGR